MGAQLKFAFVPTDTTTCGCIFTSGKSREVYLRAHVSNPTNANAGPARLFLTRLERQDVKGTRTLLCDDSLPLNWAFSHGATIEFFGGMEHYADLLRFTLGAKTWAPMTLTFPSLFKKELSASGIYRLHLLLAGPSVEPLRAIFELRWPVKKLLASAFSFSLT